MPSILADGWLLAALLTLFLAGALWWWSLRSQRKSGLPSAQVLFTDGDLRPWKQPLYDASLNLSGKPDYVVALSTDEWVPVEVKSGRTPQRPYEGHVYQALAYGLLLERVKGKRVPYVVIRYPERTFAIPFTAERRASLLHLLERMHEQVRRGTPPGPSHRSVQRCRQCGYRDYCTFRLDEAS